MSEQKEARRRVEYAHGVCAALAVVASFDQETVWREIVAANGGYDYLYGISKRAGNLRIDGFARYRKGMR